MSQELEKTVPIFLSTASIVWPHQQSLNLMEINKLPDTTSPSPFSQNGGEGMSIKQVSRNFQDGDIVTTVSYLMPLSWKYPSGIPKHTRKTQALLLKLKLSPTPISTGL